MATITNDVLDTIQQAAACERPAARAEKTFTNGARTAIFDLCTALRGVIDAGDDAGAARDVIDDYLNVVDNYRDERVFSLYWLTGAVQTVTGTSLTAAMNNAGYGAGALSALDFHAEGEPDPDWYWDDEARSWKRKSWGGN